MKIFLKIITIISFGFLIESCKKDAGFTLDCTDPDAINYNPDATDDNGSCIFSNSYLLNGEWNITNIEYETEVLTQTISGEANDAGFWSFQYPENTCSNSLSFVTEGINILGQTLPGFPIDVSNNGTWGLSNNDNTLTITDDQTGAVSIYQILSVQENICFLEGQIQTEILTMTYSVDVEMQLTKQ